MRSGTRLVLALCTLAIGLIATDATSQIKNQRCFFNISCGDKKAPCVKPAANACIVCTGTTVGNFCFSYENAECSALAISACGRKYLGACIAPCITCPKVCVALTYAGDCVATRCN